MRSRLIILATALLALAGSAVAAGSGSVSTTLSPNKVSKASTVSVTAKGPFGFTGLPSEAKVTVQKGFRSTAKSVRVLCSTAQASGNTCPVKSKIGSGTAAGTGVLLGFTQQDTVTFTLFLGKPQKQSDIASVVIVGTDSVFNTTAHATGRLFKPPGGGLELLFSKLPSFNTMGATVTVNEFSLTAGATRTVKKGQGKKKHKVRYALITNPRKCTGHWTGTLTVTFPSGIFSKALTTPCRS